MPVAGPAIQGVYGRSIRKPLMYGYMQVREDEPDAALRHTERELMAFAETEGYCFGAFFHEFDDGSGRAFTALMA